MEALTQLRDFIEKEVAVNDEVSPDYEIARMLNEQQEKTFFFENVKNSEFKVAGNLCPSRDRLCSAIGTDRKGYIKTVLRAMKNPAEPVISKKGECYECSKKSLDELPILRHFERDGGRYITAGIVIAKDDEHGRNVSVHRMMVIDGKTLGIRLVERHLYEYHRRAEGRGEALEVAVAIGVHPAALFAASYSAPLGYDELKLASSLLNEPLELVKCKTIGLEVPGNAEIVIEGKILPNTRADEGPFVDITGTYDAVRKQPVIKVSHIAHRKNAVYQALLPSSREHRIFMGMPQEPRVYGAVSKVANVKNVCLTDGGCNWLHGAVSILKGREEDGKKAVYAALEGHPSMKHVVIVDNDIDVFNPTEVEFAIATRFQGDRDMVVLKGVKGSSLDPSAGKDSMTTKIGFDATKNLGTRGSFERARIP